MLDVETCVVVDSGALSTTVAVVIGGRVIPQRWRLLPVGGWHVAYHLKQAMHWYLKGCYHIPISYLDTLPIKERCRLSYNIKNEEKKIGQKAGECIKVRVRSYADNKQFLVSKYIYIYIKFLQNLKLQDLFIFFREFL